MTVGLKWIVSFCIITLVAVGGLFWSPISDFPNTGEFLDEENIVGADVAWILAAAGLVLLMTPGLSFFYGGMVGKKKCNFHNASEFYCVGSDFYSVGSYWLFPFLWRFNRLYHEWGALRNYRQSAELSFFQQSRGFAS